MARGGGQRVVAVVADIHGEAFGLQRLADERRRFFFVFNDQNTHEGEIKRGLRSGEIFLLLHFLAGEKVV